jgi:hypothetical protein
MLSPFGVGVDVGGRQYRPGNSFDLFSKARLLIYRANQ